jgi:hypothetical protein
MVEINLLLFRPSVLFMSLTSATRTFASQERSAKAERRQARESVGNWPFG